MKKFILLCVSLGFLLFGCDQSQQEIVDPKTVESPTDETNPSGANLRPYAIGPDLVIYKVVQTGPAGNVPDGTALPLVYVPARIYVTNVGNRTAYASETAPIRVNYFQRVQVGPVQWGQPATNYVLYQVIGWQFSCLKANLNPGETRVLNESLGVDARDLPSSKIMQLSCFIDPTNQVVETDEVNNTQGLWSLNFEGI
jgi:hypothetical protein